MFFWSFLFFEFLGYFGSKSVFEIFLVVVYKVRILIRFGSRVV